MAVVFAISALALLVFSPAAQAKFNVHHFWGNPTTAAGTIGGQFSSKPTAVAVRDSNGDVYVVDSGNNRIEQFTGSGSFIRAWGRDVIVAGKANDNGTGFEICDTTTVPPNVPADCKAGVTSPLLAGTLSSPSRVAVNQLTGDVYVSDTNRVQRFTEAGAFVSAWGGGVADAGATGTGTVVPGSTSIGSVVTTSKAFFAGQTITGTGIAPGTLITAVGAGTITMSQAADAGATGAGTAISAAAAAGNVPRNEVQILGLGANTSGGNFKITYTTPNPSNTTQTTGGSVTATTTSGSESVTSVANVTGTGTTTSGSKSVTAVTSPASFFAGQTIVGDGIPSNTTIAAISGTTITLSANATASATGVSLSVVSKGTGTTTSGSNQLTSVVTTSGTGTLTSGSKSVTAASATTGAFLVGQVVTGTGIPGGTGTGTLTVGSKNVTTVTGTFVVGEAIFGTGIPAGATIAKVEAGTLELSVAATTSGAQAITAGTTLTGVSGTTLTLSVNATASGAQSLSAGAQPFLVGQAVSGAGIPAGSTITAVAGQSLTLSANATASASGVALSATAQPVLSVGMSVTGAGIPAGTTVAAVAPNGDLTLSANATASASALPLTIGIPYNASAATVESALVALPNIGAGNVAVTSNNPGGGAYVGGPYRIEFKGARFADTDVATLSVSPATLTVDYGQKEGSATPSISGASSPEVCTVVSTCKPALSPNPSGGIPAEGGLFPTVGILASAPPGAPNEGNILVGGDRRVQEFTPGGAFVRAFGNDVVSSGPGKNVLAATTQKVTIVGSSGTFILSAGVLGGPRNTPPLPYNASAAEVESALNALPGAGGAGGSYTVTGGPGDATGSSPYLVTAGGTLATGSPSVGVVAIGLGLAAGTGLTCTLNIPAGILTLKYQWLRNGSPIEGAENSTYSLAPTDAGKAIQCQVSVTSKSAGFAEGGQSIVSFPAALGSPVPSPFPPHASTAPVLSTNGALNGTATREVTCPAGIWSGPPTSYRYQWYRNGTPFGPPTGPTSAPSNVLTLTAAEQTSPALFQCMVTGTNAGGSTAAMSTFMSTATPASSVEIGSTKILLPSSVSTVTAGKAGFEVCTAAAGDVCAAAAIFPGSGAPDVGQLTAFLQSVAEDSTGAIYALEGSIGTGGASEVNSTMRMQKFTPQAGPPALSPSFFAASTLNSFQSSISTESIFPGVGIGYLAIDPASNGLYVGGGHKEQNSVGESISDRRILKIDSTGALQDTYLLDPDVPTVSGVFDSMGGLAVRGGGGPLYFTTVTGSPTSSPSNRARVFAVEDFTAPLATFAETTDIGGHSATLNATLAPGAAPLDTTYHFEYSPNGADWTKVPATDIKVGNGSGGPLDPDSCPTGNPALCNISQEITGLRANRTYFIRLVARTELGVPETVEGESFVTSEDLPSAVTGAARWSSPADTGPSLLFTGTVNPSSSRTLYGFEYVTQEEFEESGYAEASIAPKKPTPLIEAGRGYLDIEAKQSVDALDPTKTYHYRLFATNSSGLSTGADRTVVPPQPTDRYFEWVSEGDSQNLGVIGFKGITGDGERAYYEAEAIGNPQSLPSLYGGWISSRGASGWELRDATPDPNFAYNELFGDYYPSLDLSAMLWDRVPGGGYIRRHRGFSVVSIDGSTSSAPFIVEPLDPQPAYGAANHHTVGTSADFSHIVFQPPRIENQTGLYMRVLPEEPATTHNMNLPEIVGLNTGSPELKLVNRRTDGTLLGGTCGTFLGGAPSDILGGRDGEQTHAISDDGSVMYFNARPVPAAENENGGACSSFPRRVFKRIDDTTTVAVSTSECNRVANPPEVPACETTAPSGAELPPADDEFRAASADGAKVFIRSTRQLTNADVDSTADLYLYDTQTRNEVQRLVVNATAGTYKLTFGSGGPGVSETTAIAWDAPASGASSVQSALEALGNVGSGNVAVSGGPGGTNPYLIEFQGTLADKPQPPLGKVSAGLTGSAAVSPFVSGGHLTQVSAGEAVAVDHPTIGSGAKVLNYLAAGADGSRVYFRAEGRLTSAAPAFGKSIYVYERDAAHPNGRIAYVARSPFVDADFNGKPNAGVRASEFYAFPLFGAGEEGYGDGRYLVFTTAEALLAADTDTVTDIYRYDDAAASNKLVCVTCAGNAAAPVAMDPKPSTATPDHTTNSRIASEDASTIVFATVESLLPSDENLGPVGDCLGPLVPPGCDVYAWSEGSLEMVTSGSGAKGGFHPKVSADGTAVFFTTAAQLTLRDLNSAVDVYAARVGGGFPEPPGPGVSCQSSEECHEAPGPTPPPAAPGSATFSGPGNSPVAAPKCPKGKISKHGKCVKKKAHKKSKKSHKQRAGNNRGGAK